jgi:hypothetical protein
MPVRSIVMVAGSGWILGLTRSFAGLGSARSARLRKTKWRNTHNHPCRNEGPAPVGIQVIFIAEGNTNIIMLEHPAKSVNNVRLVDGGNIVLRHRLVIGISIQPFDQDEGHISHCRSSR